MRSCAKIQQPAQAFISHEAWVTVAGSVKGAGCLQVSPTPTLKRTNDEDASICFYQLTKVLSAEPTPKPQVLDFSAVADRDLIKAIINFSPRLCAQMIGSLFCLMI